MNTPVPIPAWMAAEVAEYDLDISPAPRTILDIGANIGAFSLAYAEKYPEAQIYAYEPVAQNFLALKANVSAAGLDNVSVIQRAIRRNEGTFPIFLGDHGVTCSFIQRGRQTDQTELVHCLAAKDFISADFIKIDTEGCELEILEGLNLADTRAIVVEYHSAIDRRSIAALLVDRGFQCLQHIPHDDNFGVLKFRRDGDAGVTLPAPTPEKPAPLPVQTSSIANRKVFIATVAHFANFDHAFVSSVVGFMGRPTIAAQLAKPCCDPSVERARNILTAAFLASDCTHLLFVDADIGFHPEHVARIASHNEPVVGGMYPLKTVTREVQWCGNGLAAGEAPIRADGLCEVKYIGTGFLCIQREVFETMIARGVAEKYKQDFPPHREEFAFWTQGVRAGRFLTEDWMFCQRWLELGGKIYADSQVVLRHAGRAEWPLPLQTGHPASLEK